ncbi:MAG: hypothetical protein EB066_07065 [Betaproteobacteria bacterium]|nr:hypothetical protein [Betaproteobacteria bacterium]NDF06178.1 hypothetical protein [Betaproteobacteria bacterium]
MVACHVKQSEYFDCDASAVPCVETLMHQKIASNWCFVCICRVYLVQIYPQTCVNQSKLWVYALQ